MSPARFEKIARALSAEKLYSPTPDAILRLRKALKRARARAGSPSSSTTAMCSAAGGVGSRFGREAPKATRSDSAFSAAPKSPCSSARLTIESNSWK